MITLYTIHCPNCNTLEKRLEKAGLEYTVVDDTTQVVEFVKAHGLKSAPVLDTGEEVLDYNKAMKWVGQSTPLTSCGSCGV